MFQIYEGTEKNEILDILRAHPKLAIEKNLTKKSSEEQSRRRSQLRKTNSRLTAAMAGALLSPGSPQGVEKDSSIKERERAKRWSGQVGSGRVSRVSSKRAWRVKSASAAGVGGRAATFFVPVQYLDRVAAMKRAAAGLADASPPPAPTA